jgi:hypothetical protein
MYFSHLQSYAATALLTKRANNPSQSKAFRQVRIGAVKRVWRLTEPISGPAFGANVPFPSKAAMGELPRSRSFASFIFVRISWHSVAAQRAGQLHA